MNPIIGTLLSITLFCGHVVGTVLFINWSMLHRRDTLLKDLACILLFLLSVAWIVFLLFLFDPLHWLPRGGEWIDHPLLVGILKVEVVLSLAVLIHCIVVHPLQQRRQVKLFAEFHDPKIPHRRVHRQTTDTQFKRFGGIIPKIGTNSLVVVHQDLYFEKLSEEFEGMKVLQLSDFHHNHQIEEAYARWVMDTAKALQPDLIFITGDFVNDTNHIEASCRLWLDLDHEENIFAVRGNHDFTTCPETIAQELEQLNVRLLADEQIEFERGGKKIIIAGIEAPYNGKSRQASLDCVSKNDFGILLSHAPDNAPPAADCGWDWIVSGHTHGGQNVLPWVGPIVVPSKYGRRFAHGTYRVGDSLLSVTSGIGCHTPFRLFNPPEIVCYYLHKI